jgi:hypothetical protein
MKVALTRIVAAAVCLLATAFFLLVAFDAHAFERRIGADDLTFRHEAIGRGLWRPRELAPFGATRAVLSADDNLLYRRALFAFRVGRPRESIYDQATTAKRIRAQVALQKFLATSSDDRRRSQAANLIGVLGFAAATQDAGQRVTFLNDAIASFRTAIELDPANDDAYFNLEYALDQLKEATEQEGGSGKRLGGTGGAGARETGHGY